MTNAIPIRIADAVTTEINSAAAADAFSIGEFEARRSYADWDDKFSDLSIMAVDVVYVVSQSTIELDAAGSLEYNVAIDIAVRKRFEPVDRDESTGRLLNASVDPLVTLLQELHEHFVAARNTIVLDAVTEANWTDSQMMSWVNQRKLREGMFEGVVRIKFNVPKVI